MYLNEPLELRQGFNDTARTFGSCDVLSDVLFLFKQSFAREPCHDHIARLTCFLSFKSPMNRHLRIFVYDDRFMRKFVPVGNIPVGLAVSRRDADRARAEGRVHFCIGDNFYMNGHVAENHIIFFADICSVACVIRMYGNRDVAHFGFGTSCCDRDGEVLGIPKCIEFRGAFLIHDFIV